jgi:hypothetical protein
VFSPLVFAGLRLFSKHFAPFLLIACIEIGASIHFFVNSVETGSLSLPLPNALP